MSIQIKLIKPHSHAGVQFEPGQKVGFSDVEAQWLVENRIGEFADKESDPKSGKDSKK